MAEGDRRPDYRPKNLKPGESKHHDDQGQYSHMARDGHYAVAKQHNLTAGDTPDMTRQELNEQLKDVAARPGALEGVAAGAMRAIGARRCPGRRWTRMIFLSRP